MNNPNVARGTLQIPLQPEKVWREKLANPPPGLYSLVALSGPDVVGTAGVKTSPDKPRIKHVGSVFIAVRPDFQGRGVGSLLVAALLDLADNWLGLVRVELEVYPDNAPAVALYKKFGFEVEGTLRKSALRDGEYVDSLVMARLFGEPRP